MNNEKLQKELKTLFKSLDFSKNITPEIKVCTNQFQINSIIKSLGVSDINAFYYPYYFMANPKKRHGIHIFSVCNEKDILDAYFFHRYHKEEVECIKHSDINNSPDFLTLSKHLGIDIWSIFVYLNIGLHEITAVWPEQVHTFIEVGFQKYFENLINKQEDKGK